MRVIHVRARVYSQDSVSAAHFAGSIVLYCCLPGAHAQALSHCPLFTAHFLSNADRIVSIKIRTSSARKLMPSTSGFAPLEFQTPVTVRLTGSPKFNMN